MEIHSATSEILLHIVWSLLPDSQESWMLAQKKYNWLSMTKIESKSKEIQFTFEQVPTYIWISIESPRSVSIPFSNPWCLGVLNDDWWWSVDTKGGEKVLVQSQPLKATQAKEGFG